VRIGKQVLRLESRQFAQRHLNKRGTGVSAEAVAT